MLKNFSFTAFLPKKSYLCQTKFTIMAFTFFNNREPRQFNYKPRYYDPKKEESTGDSRRDFARNLHDEWQSKRNHTGEKKNNSSITILFMIFFVIVLALVLWKFF